MQKRRLFFGGWGSSGRYLRGDVRLGTGRAVESAKPYQSNDLAFLRQIAGEAYMGANLYQQQGAVRDGNLITASGTAPLDFAYLILELLGVFESDTLNFWYRLHKEQRPEYFYQLMESLPTGKPGE